MEEEGGVDLSKSQALHSPFHTNICKSINFGSNHHDNQIPAPTYNLIAFV